MSILVTGASGFVGRSLIPLLISKHRDVIGVDLVSFGRRDKPEFYRHFTGDLNDPSFLKTIFQRKSVRVDGVIHLAGRVYEPAASSDPKETFKINVNATGSLLTALRYLGSKPRFLLTSSCAVYGRLPDGNNGLVVSEDTPLNPITIYGESKAEQERLVMEAHEDGIIEAVITRTFNLIGPGEDPRFVSSAFMKQALEIKRDDREPVLEVGNLESVRDYTDIRDAVKGYFLAYEKGNSGEVYNICSGRGVKTSELLNKILKTVDVDPEIRQNHARLRPADIPVMGGDTLKTKSELGWEAEMDLEVSLRDLMQSFS